MYITLAVIAIKAQNTYGKQFYHLDSWAIEITALWFSVLVLEQEHYTFFGVCHGKYLTTNFHVLNTMIDFSFQISHTEHCSLINYRLILRKSNIVKLSYNINLFTFSAFTLLFGQPIKVCFW